MLFLELGAHECLTRVVDGLEIFQVAFHALNNLIRVQLSLHDKQFFVQGLQIFPSLLKIDHAQSFLPILLKKILPNFLLVPKQLHLLKISQVNVHYLKLLHLEGKLSLETLKLLFIVDDSFETLGQILNGGNFFIKVYCVLEDIEPIELLPMKVHPLLECWPHLLDLLLEFLGRVIRLFLYFLQPPL